MIYLRLQSACTYNSVVTVDYLIVELFVTRRAVPYRGGYCG